MSSPAARVLGADAFGKRAFKCVIFDVDGTLYQLERVRRRMRGRLLCDCLKHPWRGYATLRILSAYRRAQEAMRTTSAEYSDIASAQLAAACAATGVSAELAAPIVEYWMERAPLDLLGASLREGTPNLLRRLKQLGFRLGVLSDYPSEAKLASLGIGHFFDVVVSAQDPEVQRFKPDPRGIEVILRHLRVNNDEALYVGDRPEVDALAARRAGVSCVIVGGGRHTTQLFGHSRVSNFRELAAAFEGPAGGRSG
jgi:HAD superfamily hydrolase (TIGR01549 family)